MTEMVKKTRRHIPVILLAVSLFLAGVMTVKVMAYAASSMTVSAKIANAVDAVNCEDEELKTYTVKYTNLAGELKKKSVFAPPPAKKKNPVKQVVAIFGKEAFINGKWYKAGDKVADAKIVAVNPTSVETLWDGKKKTFRPFDSGVASGPGGSSRPGRPTASSRGSSSSSGKGPQMVVIKSSTGTGLRMGGMREMHDIVSEIQREKLRREMEKTREKYMHMSETERAKFKVEMLEKLSRERSK